MSKRPASACSTTSAAATQITRPSCNEGVAKERRTEYEIEIDRAKGLCGACSTIFYSWDAIETTAKPLKYQVLYYFGCYVVREHHWHLNVLNESARRGCRLCALLRQALVSRGYRSPESFRSRDWGRGYRRAIVGELCIYRVKGSFALEVHFAHEWVAPQGYSGRLEPFENEDWGPPPATYHVLVHATSFWEPSFDLQDHRTDLLATARRWFDHCELHHGGIGCIPNDRNGFSPTRLIKLGPGLPHLVLSESLDGPVRYATLSHCWGKLAIHKLLQNNTEKFQKGIPAEMLCRTFRDAILIAQLVGLQYLWIDSLCIIQDDAADWQRESSTMCDVYTHTTLNIAATSARDGSEGCFMDIDEGYVASHGITAANQQSYICANNNLYACNVLDTPLGSRAWVVQERLLPSRKLHCGKNQFFWVCRNKISCEAYPESLPRGFIRETDHPPLDWEESWRAVVAQYSRCALTRLSDKLVAISGLAKRVSRHRSPGDQYLAGVWLNSLHIDLCWRTEKQQQQQQQPGTPTSLQQSDIYQAPSWSWAAWNKQVSFPQAPSSNWVPLMTTLQAEIQHVGDDPYGALGNAALWITPRFFLKTTIPPHNRHVKAQRFGENSVSMVISWDSCLAAEGTVDLFYFCSVLRDVADSQIQGIVLLPTGSVVVGEYKRVGHFTALVEGWPYERFERVAEMAVYERCRAQVWDYVAGFWDGDGDREEVLAGVVKII